ncbi:hypothetical protein NQZ68_010287, partial [Dissostichus eleginoides]
MHPPPPLPPPLFRPSAYQRIPRKPRGDVMRYGFCSNTDISVERAPHSFQSMTQNFWLPFWNLLLQLPRSSTLTP